VSAWLDSLNDQQRAAATAAARMLYIEAGAGTGKTRTLIARISNLIAEGTAPQEILAVCFTRAACEELKKRLHDQVGDLGSLVHVHTFHSLGLSLLRECGAMGKHVSVASEGEELNCLRTLFDGSTRRPEARKTCMRDVRRLATTYESVGPEHPLAVTDRKDDPHAARLYDLWMNRLLIQHRVAFCAILPTLETHLLNSEVGREVLEDATGTRPVRQFDHVIVDEAHDCTPLEWGIAKRLSRVGIAFVYDPRQAIFGWRGGMEPHTLEALGKMNEGSVLALPLAGTYRFGARLCNFANAISLQTGTPTCESLYPSDRNQDTKLRVTTTAGTEALFGIVRELSSRYAGDVAVLARTNLELDSVAESLGENAIIRNTCQTPDPLLAAAVMVCKLAMNPKDNTTFITLAHQAGLEESQVRDLVAAVGYQEPLFHAWKKERVETTLPSSDRCLLDIVPTIRPERVTLEDVLRDCMAVLVGAPGRPLVPSIPKGMQLPTLGLRIGPEAIDACMEIIREENRGAWLAKQSHMPLISTVHAAKGLEWRAVVVLTSERWPTPDQEEQRVYYVAATRASEELVVVRQENDPYVPSRAVNWNRRDDDAPTR
jgi:DNA helicase-2/ATP-dependent DNA helicase PcrA